ncbi:MAG: glycosyltransferase family 39 protein [Leeuwenhoekiella sp.]
MGSLYKIDRYYIGFLFIAFTLLLYGLGSYGLAETSEARYAEISREMFLNGDYLNPELLGIFHFHKPPITYYITTLGYRIFGINEFGARFFLQVAVILQLLLVYGLAQLLYKDKKIAFLSGMIYFAMPIVLISSRNLTTDAYLTTFILAAIYCWQRYINGKSITVLYIFYILVGIALLTKGPVALIFIISYILIEKIVFKRSAKVNIHHIAGVLLSLVIGTSWYVFVMIENPRLWDYFIEKQLVSRMNADSFNRAKPFWYYGILLLGLIFPWWLVLPRVWQKLSSLKRISKPGLLLIANSALIFLIFSLFTTKLILYILPMFWMSAIIIATQIRYLSRSMNKAISVIYLTLVVVVSLIIIGLWVIKTPLFESTTYSALAALGVVIASFFIYLAIDDYKYYKPVVMAAVFGGGLLILSSTVLSDNSAMINSTRDLISFINHIDSDRHKTIIVDDELLTSVPFYTDAHLVTLKDRRNTTQREVQFENDLKWQEDLWDLHELSTITKLDSVTKTSGNFFIIKKKDVLQKDLSFLKSRYSGEKDYPKWRLFYNKK